MICVGSQWILGPLILSHTQISSLPGIRQKCCWGLFMEHWHDLPSWTVEQHKRLMVFYDSHTLDPCWFFHQWGSFILLRNVSLSQNYKHNNNIYIYINYYVYYLFDPSAFICSCSQSASTCLLAFHQYWREDSALPKPANIFDNILKTPWGSCKVDTRSLIVYSRVPAPTGSVLNSGFGTYFEEQLDYQSNFQLLGQSLPRSVIAKPPAELAGPLHKLHSCFHPASFHFTDVHEQAQLEM